jgi:hypothetical protein
MKKYLFLIIIIIISCKIKQPAKEIIKIDTQSVDNKTDTVSIQTDSHFFWSSELDPKKGLVMIRTLPISEDSLTVTKLIQMLNDLYPEIQLRYARISNDSIFVQINKSTYLTKQMGSSGAEAYLAEATFNLTELKGINFVDFKFKAGDHASPATFTRTDFIRVRN